MEITTTTAIEVSPTTAKSLAELAREATDRRKAEIAEERRIAEEARQKELDAEKEVWMEAFKKALNASVGQGCDCMEIIACRQENIIKFITPYRKFYAPATGDSTLSKRVESFLNDLRKLGFNTSRFYRYSEGWERKSGKTGDSIISW